MVAHCHSYRSKSISHSTYTSEFIVRVHLILHKCMHTLVCVYICVSNLSTSVSYLSLIANISTNPAIRGFICDALKNSGLSQLG